MGTIKKIIIKLISFPVKIVLKRKKPDVIAVTGSAGKTTCKEFIGKLLDVDFEVLVPAEGYNTEIGAPLAFFGEKVPTKLTSFPRWIWIIIKIYFKALFTRDFPSKVVVEMGADSPGDIKHLAELFKPKIGIVLEVLPVHMAQFKTTRAISEEKSELVKAIPENGHVYLNYDNPEVRAMISCAKAPVTYFGTAKGFAGFRAEALSSDITGISFNIKEDDNKYNFKALVFGKHMVYPLLAAIAVANGEGISMNKLVGAVRELRPFKGRMNVIEGINGSVVIDDSYNANPRSVISALDFLKEQKGRRIAMLGTMNELGDYEEEAHRLVGLAAANSADYIFTVGDPAEKYLIPAAEEAGFKRDRLKPFKTAKEAGLHVARMLKEGDIVLAKGSQNNVRMEQAIEKFMANPELKKQILVRQSDFWMN
jgi:UDP-N-acetylmuramoyl-tripeptide--D-alanyl-D-alanine ligase